jgi:xanthine dehydrogenase accessory factor
VSDGGPGFRAVRDALRAERPVAVCTVVSVADGGPATIRVGARLVVEPPDRRVGGLGSAELDRVVALDVVDMLVQGRSQLRHYGARGEPGELVVGVFVETYTPPPQLLLVGAVDLTGALAQIGKVLGYDTTVCDPRAAFATAQRYPEADRVLVEWPHRLLQRVELDERAVICVLTHDARIDVPALLAAVATPAGYIGAMGSRRTTEDRAERLRAAGMSEADLARIAAPIGLDLGSRTPAETAISIFAEVVATRTGHGAEPLRDSGGPIHG